MSAMPIGVLGRKAGVTPSAIRYYERAGLLAKPARQSGQRRYAPEALARLRIIQTAREAGFTIAETKTFLAGFSATTPPAARWRSLAHRKLKEIDALLARAARMKALLESSFQCDCLCIQDCERVLLSSVLPVKPHG